MICKNKQHPHYDIIKAWVDGKQIQYWNKDSTKWIDCNGPDWFPTWDKNIKYRVKLEKDKSWKPQDGEEYFYICSDGTIVSTICDYKSVFNNKRICFGNCFRTEDDAKSVFPMVQHLLKGNNPNIPILDGTPLNEEEESMIRKFREISPRKTPFLATDGEIYLIEALRNVEIIQVFERYEAKLLFVSNNSICSEDRHISFCVSCESSEKEEQAIVGALNLIKSEQNLKQ